MYHWQIASIRYTKDSFRINLCNPDTKKKSSIFVRLELIDQVRHIVASMHGKTLWKMKVGDDESYADISFGNW